jgi:hypothetical protein
MYTEKELLNKFILNDDVINNYSYMYSSYGMFPMELITKKLKN